MNSSSGFCTALLALCLLMPSHFARSHENPGVRGIDDARNHLIQESLPAVYRVEINGTVYDTKTKEVKKENAFASSHGTAFGVSGDGLVLTKMHVLNPYMGKIKSKVIARDTFEYEDGDTIKLAITLTTRDGAKYNATIIGGDPSGDADLALLQITTEREGGFPFLSLADDVLGYDVVITIGNPYVFRFSVGEGVVSSPDSVVFERRVMQTTALILPGSSGGPIIRVRDHKVVGMMESMYSPTPGAIANLGFGTPAPVLIEFLTNEPGRFKKAHPE